MSVLIPEIGETLRRERELRSISLEEVAQSTRIPLRTLQQMEHDEWQSMPGEVFAKGFLRSYARCLGLDPRPFLARFDARNASKVDPIPMQAMAPQEKGRRFGIAIAVVVLLVLFTLALSIVLRPRRRDVPVELSLRTPMEVIRDEDRVSESDGSELRGVSDSTRVAHI